MNPNPSHQPLPLERALIHRMFEDDLATARVLLTIGDFAMAAESLAQAIEKIHQLKSITDPAHQQDAKAKRGAANRIRARKLGIPAILVDDSEDYSQALALIEQAEREHNRETLGQLTPVAAPRQSAATPSLSADQPLPSAICHLPSPPQAFVTTTDTCSHCGAKLTNAETSRLDYQAQAYRLSQELKRALGLIKQSRTALALCLPHLLPGTLAREESEAALAALQPLTVDA